MGHLPPKLREECAADPQYRTCMRYEALHDHECSPDPLTGRLIEWEHAVINAGSQVQKKWAILSSCWWAHRGPGLVKAVNHWIAYNRASDNELLEISKATDYFRERSRLNKVYGPYSPRVEEGIQYPWLQTQQ